MNDRHPIVLNAIALYCQWLNLWAENDVLMDFRFTSDHFLVNDHKRDLYGSTRVLVDARSYYHLVVIEADYGDDGGPATLTVWADENEPHNVYHIVQEFDTYVQTIYDATADGDPKFLNVPEAHVPKEAS